MRYQRIHVLGGSGSGKSFVASKISAAFEIPTYELDELFWDNAVPTYGTRADQEKRDQALAAMVMQEAWVIEGVFYKWVITSFQRSDLIIVLNPSLWLRQWRVVKRYALRRLGVSPCKKKETFGSLIRLLRWNQGYDKDVLVPARALLSQLNKRSVDCKTLEDVFAVLTDR